MIVGLIIGFMVGAAVVLLIVGCLVTSDTEFPPPRKWTYKECVEAGHYMTSSGDESSVWCWDAAHGKRVPYMYSER